MIFNKLGNQFYKTNALKFFTMLNLNFKLTKKNEENFKNIINK